MSKLKIIEATYYDPNNIAGGFNVTKELIQMIDFDNDNLFYGGSYNDIFGDPAKRTKKRLKIILEYQNQKHTHIYKEDDLISLPNDLEIRATSDLGAKKNDGKSRKFFSELYDLFIIEPNFMGLGVNIKKLISKITSTPTLLKDIVLCFIVLLVIFISSYWWFLPATKFLKEVQRKYFINYNDPSKILDTSVFNILDKMNELSTDNEKQIFIDNYSGLRTDKEFGYISNISTSSKSVILVDINLYPNSLICSFDKKWEQKLFILERKDIQFVGVIDKYNAKEKKVMLLYCDILY